MGRAFQAEEQVLSVGFHRELNQQVMFEFWVQLAARDWPDLLGSEAPLDKVFEKLAGVSWDAFWQAFPNDLQAQCPSLDDDAISALTILTSTTRARQRFMRLFDNIEHTAEAPHTPPPRVGSVRSRTAAGLGLEANHGSNSNQRGSERFAAVHEALTADDEDLVSIVMDLVGPYTPKLAPRGPTRRRLREVEAAAPALPQQLVARVAEQVGGVQGGACGDRVFNLVVPSGRSRSALAAGAALQLPGCRPVYVDLRGMFGDESLENALFYGVFGDGSGMAPIDASDSEANSLSLMFPAAEGEQDDGITSVHAAEATAVAVAAAGSEGGGGVAARAAGAAGAAAAAGSGLGAAAGGSSAAEHVAAAAVPGEGLGGAARSSEGGAQAVETGAAAPLAAGAAAAGADKAAAEQGGDDCCTSGADQQQGREGDASASGAGRRADHEQGHSREGTTSSSPAAAAGQGSTDAGGGGADVGSEGRTNNNEAAGSGGLRAAEPSSGDATAMEENDDEQDQAASRAWVQDGWDCAPELVYAQLKLLGLAYREPLLLVLDEVDAAMAYGEGRALRDMLHKLVLLLPRARVLLVSSAECQLGDCTLLGFRGLLSLALPDSRGTSRCYRVLQMPLLY